VFKERDIFPFNDNEAVMMLSQSIYKAIVALQGQNPCFCIRLFVSPSSTVGVLSIIVGDQDVKKAAIVSYREEMYDALHTPKEEQLALLQTHWKISTTRDMMRKVIDAVIEKADPSHDAETLQILLNNIDMLPAEGQYLAQPVVGSRAPDDMSICWFIQRSELEATDKFCNSEVIEIVRIPEWTEIREASIFVTCMFAASMIIKVNKALETNT